MSFRMAWMDPRIVVDLNGTEEEYAYLYRDQRDRFWFPDLLITNSIDINVPKLTLEPILLRVYENGRVESSIRKEVQSICPMNFINYPVSTSRHTHTFTILNKIHV